MKASIKMAVDAPSFPIPQSHPMKRDIGEDFKEWVKETIGTKVDALEIFNSKVLVAKFIRVKSAGGIIIPGSAQKEDEWQGKVGLVLKMGPGAFRDTPETGANFYGVTVKPGEWVTYRYSDGYDFNFKPNGGEIEVVKCRLLEDVDILGRIPNPEMFW